MDEFGVEVGLLTALAAFCPRPLHETRDMCTESLLTERMKSSSLEDLKMFGRIKFQSLPVFWEDVTKVQTQVQSS